MKAPKRGAEQAPVKSIAEQASEEGNRRFQSRVIQTYIETGSYSRAAQQLRISEEVVKFIVEKGK